MKNILNIILVFTATLDCNQRCPWCIRDKLNSEFNLSLNPMSVETAQRILTEYPKSTQIVLTGGEPMLNMDLVEYIVSTGRKVKISTNGSIKVSDLQLYKNNDVLFDISVNSLPIPPLLQQLIDEDYPKQKIRVFTYLHKDKKRVEAILKKICSLPIRGYEVLPDIWVEFDSEYKDFIMKMIPMLAEFHKEHQKDHGYLQYIKQDTANEPPCIKFKFAPTGEKISDLWTQGLPEKERTRREKKIYNDIEVMRYGKEHFRKGAGDFNMPVEYYTALMYEEMSKYLRD